MVTEIARQRGRVWGWGGEIPPGGYKGIVTIIVLCRCSYKQQSKLTQHFFLSCLTILYNISRNKVLSLFVKISVTAGPIEISGSFIEFLNDFGLFPLGFFIPPQIHNL